MPYRLSTAPELSCCDWRECSGCQSPTRTRDRRTLRARLQALTADPTAMAVLRRLISRLDAGVSLARTSDDGVIARFAELIDRGRVRLCGRATQGTAGNGRATRDPERIAEERVIRALGPRTRDFVFEGWTLRFIHSSQWSSVRTTGRYEILTSGEAVRIIARMTAATSIPATEKGPLQAAAQMLPAVRDGWSDKGLLLLRLVPVYYVEKADEPPLTPSQLKRQQEKHWVEIQMVDEMGVGVAGIAYKIIAPDNQEYTGMTDEDGCARVNNIPAGQCKISFPELDKSSWRPV